MKRTSCRPLPSGRVSVKQALVFAVILLTVGLSWAFTLDILYGTVVFAGLFIDFVIYTLWLKRRTAWAILFGGISGGMPILAGRVLAMSGIDYIGIILCLAILFWIPTHIMTFSIKYKKDYSKASIPTFPIFYGEKNTRLIITLSSIASALFIGFSVIKIGLPTGHIYILTALSAILFGISVLSIYKPSEKLNLALFKYASVFMLLSMILIMVARF
jgi:protoheme IX farnesyltransferase